MGSITTAFCTSAKSELLTGGHCFNGAVTPTGNTHTTTTVDSVSAMTGVGVGMNVTGSGVSSNTWVAQVISATSFALSQATSSSLSGTTLTIGGDSFNMALIIASPTGVYGAGTVNYTDVTGNSDEVTGAGYGAGGLLMANNTSPAVTGTTAYITWSMNPSWTTATFSTGGCLIYNSSTFPRLGGTSGTNTVGKFRALGVFSFGGTQTVTAGTFTVLLPSATSSTAIFRVA